MNELHSGAKPRNPRLVWLSLVAVMLFASSALPALAASRQTVQHHTPNYVFTAKSLGSEDPSKTIEVSVWLNLHNRAEFDSLASQLYDPTSPKYRQFLTRAKFASRYAPTANEAKTVQKFFERNNLKVVEVGSHNMFVRARGTVADVESAFQVKLNNYQVGDKVIRSNDRDPSVDADVAPLVRSIGGMGTGKFEHPAMQRPTAPKVAKGAAVKSVGITAQPASTDFYTNNCFNGVETESFSNNNDGSFPVGTYSGNHINLQSLSSAGCAYTPPEIQAAYNLTGLYANGFDGTGQTIGIIDWCGSSTIQDDAAAYSAYFGLPVPNLTITYTPSPSLCIAADQVEINIDVEWAHSIAPGAALNLIVPPSADFDVIDQAWYKAIDDGLANVISGSYGAEEIFVAASELQNGNLIAEIGNVFGVASNFSTGDDGDFTFGFGLPPSVSYPADSPNVTAVGGVTLALNSDNSIAWQDGWGTNEILLAESGYVPDPPINFGFDGGSGGGPSLCATQDSEGNCLAGFPKPSFQKKVPGKARQVPDISWLADPFTGAVILISVPGQVPEQVWQVWGGTSVACPMFAGLWAIANQEAGAPLGQAAPYLYSLPAGTIFDILPQTSKTSVTASIQEPGTTNNYTAAEVAGVSGKFVSAIWDYPSFSLTALVLTFGTDSGLKVKAGWDNVTGLGSPNGQAFAEAFAPAKKGKK
jgi:subtilase family serine protease